MFDLSETMKLDRVQERATQLIKKCLKERLESDHCSYSRDSLPSAAANMRRKAAVDDIWARLEEAGLVKLDVKPDDHLDLEDLEGDMFKVDLHADTVPGGARTILAQQKRFRERVERDGVWGLVGSYRVSEGSKWIQADPIWGMEGYEDVKESDCADDVKWLTLSELANVANLHRTLKQVIEELD